MSLSIVGDIGGTNARFAIWKNEQLQSVRVFPTVDHESPEAALQVYLEDLGHRLGDASAVCLAVAGPVTGDDFHFTNSHWKINRPRFCERLKVKRLVMVNDFTAMALGMTRLGDDEFVTVRAGKGDEAAARVVIGPGTGLGVGTLTRDAEGHWIALPGEGGHVDLPLGTPREAMLWMRLLADREHVSAETVLSGAGLLALYNAVCAVDEVAVVHDSPAAITDAALKGEPVANAVLEQFCVFLGRVAGNAVLTVGGRGGVYIAGGIVPRFAEFFASSGFSQAFEAKGLMRDYFDEVPVWLVTAEYPGLNGAGVALDQALSGKR